MLTCPGSRTRTGLAPARADPPHGPAPMKRTALVVPLAVWLLSADTGLVRANPPVQCQFGYGCPTGFCLRILSKIHQHGPLFNYGPYYGYPPFDPYGPWNAYLQYNPWADPSYWSALAGGSDGRGWGCGWHGRHGCSFHGCWSVGGWFNGHLMANLHSCLAGLHARCGRSDCCGASHDLCGKPAAYHGNSTNPCGQPAPARPSQPSPTGPADPAQRLSGFGQPTQTDGFYAGLPTVLPASLFAR